MKSISGKISVAFRHAATTYTNAQIDPILNTRQIDRDNKKSWSAGS
jgi:hypothetical protein